MKGRLILIALALSFTASIAQAAPAILGIEVGAPLTLPKCDFTVLGPPTADCWAPETYDPPNQKLSRDIFLGPETEAHAEFIRHATVILDGESVAGLIILTTGGSTAKKTSCEPFGRNLGHRHATRSTTCRIAWEPGS